MAASFWLDYDVRQSVADVAAGEGQLVAKKRRVLERTAQRLCNSIYLNEYLVKRHQVIK